MEDFQKIHPGKENSIHLRKRHVEALNQLQALAAIYEKKPADFTCAAKAILDIFQKEVNFDAAWVFQFDPYSLNILNVHLYQYSEKAFSRYLNGFYTRTPIPTLHQIRKQGFVCKRGSDLVQNSAWVESPFYREILEPLGLRFFLAVASIHQRKGYNGLIVLWRSKDRRDFSREDRFFIEKSSFLCAEVLDRSRLLPVDSILKKTDILIPEASDPFS